MSLIISMPGMAAAYPTGVERVDIGTLMGIGAISGLQFWGRGNNVNAAPGGGYAFEFNDLRSGSVRKLRQPNGQAATMTAKTDSGYLGSRRTVEASAGAGSMAWEQVPAEGVESALCQRVDLPLPV